MPSMNRTEGADVKNLKRLSYHPRRVLGLLCQCQLGMGLPLDWDDSHHASPLVRCGLVDWLQNGPLRVYRATEEGRRLWQEWTSAANAAPEAQQEEKK